MTTNKKEVDHWADERNITISIATRKDLKDLKEFIHLNFYDSEPINKCARMVHGHGPVDLMLRYFCRHVNIVEPILKNKEDKKCSLIARNKDTNEIVGCNIGSVYYKGDYKNDYLPNWLRRLASFSGHHKLNWLVNSEALCKDLKYSHEDGFNDIPGVRAICFNEILCVSEKASGKGVGLELTKRACKVALDAGCRYTYIFATSAISQRIFQKFKGYKILHEVNYKDYEYDKNGRPFLFDHCEHKVIQVIALDHSLDFGTGQVEQND